MNQISKPESGKSKGDDNQADGDEIFMKLISPGGNYSFPEQDILGRLIVIPFTSRYATGQSEP